MPSTIFKPTRKTPALGKGPFKIKNRASFFSLLVFVLIFAGVGSYLLYNSFAATTGTFGKTNIGASCDAFYSDTKRVNKYSVGTTVTVSQLSIYLKPTATTGSQPMKGVLYADNNGTPGALIAATNQLTFYSTNVAGWYSLPFAAPPTLKAGNYWIGTITGSTSRVIGYCYDTASTNVRYINANLYASGPSNPFGSGTQDNRAISMNASYTVASTSPPSAPTVNLTAGPDSINAGQSSVLSWASTNASSCSAPWTSSTATSGSQSVSPATTTTYSITCSGAGGSASTSATVSVASLVGTTSSTLTYAPPGYPSYSGYTTMHVNNATPSWVTGQLNASTDYRIIIDEPLTNTLLIGGGHNVVIIGGEINKAVVSSHPYPDQTYGMYLVDQTGTIHVEGVYFHGAGLGEGVVTNEGKGATVQLENLRIEVTYPTPSDYSIHPDVFQTWRGPYILRMDHLTGSSTNKAFNFQPFEYGLSPTGTWDVRNTNLAIVGPDQSYILWRDNIEDSTQQRFPWWAETNSNFYINPDRNWGWCWPDCQHWQPFTMGVPPTGDYVPSGVAGMNYKSPGYNQ